MADFSQKLMNNASEMVSAINASMSTLDFPTTVADCVNNIDANFGSLQEKDAACQTFIGLNVPEALDAMAMGAHSFNHPILAGWCNRKAAYLRTGGDVTTPPKEIPPFPSDINECKANIDKGFSSSGSTTVAEAACELLLNDTTPALALDKAADAADAQGHYIYAAWCRQAANAKRTGTTTGDKEDVFMGLPQNQNECLLNIDAHMPQEEKLAACSELFNKKNKVEDFVDFASQANQAGYPVASEWFSIKAEQLKQEKADYTKYYYIGGGVAAFVLIFGIGYAIAKS